MAHWNQGGIRAMGRARMDIVSRTTGLNPSPQLTLTLSHSPQANSKRLGSRKPATWNRARHFA